MGREVKRVDINNPPKMGQVWEGFINPYYKKYSKECPDCKNGCSPQAEQFQNEWYGYKMGPKTTRIYSPDHPYITILARKNAAHPFQNVPNLDQNQEFRRKFLQERFRLAEIFSSQWSHSLDADDIAALRKEHRLDKYFDDKPDVTPDEVNDFYLMNGIGHDSLNAFVCIKARCKKMKIGHLCKTCRGEGRVWESKEGKKLYDKWKPIDPPKGEAYQIWETVSEGSPISPAFLNPEDLAEWMEQNADWQSDQGIKKETWMEFIVGPGWAPSFVITPTKGFVPGVKAVTEMKS